MDLKLEFSLKIGIHSSMKYFYLLLFNLLFYFDKIVIFIGSKFLSLHHKITVLKFLLKIKIKQEENNEPN